MTQETENRYMHIPAFNGTVTVCYRFNQPKGETARSITAAFAWRAPNDQFRKIRGRHIAARRLRNDDNHVINLDNEMTISQNVQKYIISKIDLLNLSALNKNYDKTSFIPRWFQTSFYLAQSQDAMDSLMMAGLVSELSKLSNMAEVDKVEVGPCVQGCDCH